MKKTLKEYLIEYKKLLINEKSDKIVQNSPKSYIESNSSIRKNSYYREQPNTKSREILYAHLPGETPRRLARKRTR